MLSLNRNGKVTCEKCGTQTTTQSVPSQKRCSTETLTCPSRANFSSADMEYHIAKRHSARTASAVYACKICNEDFHSFYLLREHKRKEHGAERGSGAQKVDVTQVI